MLKIIPLGGLGEIGMNCMLIAYERDAIVIDCGVMFPDAEQHGVDLVIPDFSLLKKLGVKVHAYIMTHGHEDHIGALPYALTMLDAPIYASRFTVGLIHHKLSEWGLSYDLNTVGPKNVLEFGSLTIEFMRVTHSIPDGLAVAVKTPLGVVIHTGDFKIDHRPIGGETTDLGRFAEYGDEGVLALLSDSTNSDREGVSTSESVIGEGLEDVMRGAEGRIFIASFASHIHRMQQVIDISQKLGRRVVLNGRSMVNNSRIARELGILKAPDDLFVPVEQARDKDPASLCILTTGSQAEPQSAMAKLARGDNQHLSIAPDDLVIFSSRSIPGNERAISGVINGLVRQGARVVSSSLARVHTSGHAHREEQRLMLNLVKPQYFMPIHGELHHLAQHARTAGEVGIPKDNIFVVEDGQSVELYPEGDNVGARLGERHHARKVYVDGKGIGDVTEMVVRDRASLAYAGICICVVMIDLDTGDAVGEPELFTRGIASADDNPALFEDAKDWLQQAIIEQTPATRRDRPAMEEALRIALRRFFRREVDRKPIVVPFVLAA